MEEESSNGEGTDSWRDDPQFASNITESVIRRYTKLPKKGKPQNTEWTIVAGISCSNRYWK